MLLYIIHTLWYLQLVSQLRCDNPQALRLRASLNSKRLQGRKPCGSCVFRWIARQPSKKTTGELRSLSSRFHCDIGTLVDVDEAFLFCKLKMAQSGSKGYHEIIFCYVQVPLLHLVDQLWGILPLIEPKNGLYWKGQRIANVDQRKYHKNNIDNCTNPSDQSTNESLT